MKPTPACLTIDKGHMSWPKRKVTRVWLHRHTQTPGPSPLVIALILSMPSFDSSVCSSVIGARGALMLAELFTARRLGHDKGGSLGASASALRSKPLEEAKCCIANILSACFVSLCVSFWL